MQFRKEVMKHVILEEAADTFKHNEVVDSDCCSYGTPGETHLTTLGKSMAAWQSSCFSTCIYDNTSKQENQ